MTPAGQAYKVNFLTSSNRDLTDIGRIRLSKRLWMRNMKSLGNKKVNIGQDLGRGDFESPAEIPTWKQASAKTIPPDRFRDLVTNGMEDLRFCDLLPDLLWQ